MGNGDDNFLRTDSLVILSENVDRFSKKINIEFIRAFNTGEGDELILKGKHKFKLWITWAIFDSPSDTDGWKVKGQREAIHEKSGMNLDSKYPWWLIPDPPNPTPTSLRLFDKQFSD